MRVARADFSSIRAKTAQKAANRAERVVDNAALGSKVAKRVKKAKTPSLSKLKKALWSEISLLVRSWSPICLACGSPTQCAAHVVPAHEGAATRFFLPNLYPACKNCNGLENWNRGSWVKKHEAMFGVDFVDALYAMSDTTFQIKKHWVLEQTARMRKLQNSP